MIQGNYSNQAYTLQLDSHHRFIKGWDTELIEMHESLVQKGIKKPLLTAYLPSYDPKKDPKGRLDEVWKMTFNRFTPEGYIFTYPANIDNFKELKEPVRARFFSAHFTFTTGEFCVDVPHDPFMYFHGEEPSISIRAYTHGYDLFHPHKIYWWHEYTREGRVKHWDDHVSCKVEQIWSDRNDISLKRLRQMLQEEDNGTDIGEFGLGNVRTHREYENYAGIDFANRILHQKTINGETPPIADDNNVEWRTIKPKEYFIEVDWTEHWPKLKSQTSCTCNFDFIYLGIESQDQQLLHRYDLTHEDFLNGKNTKQDIKFTAFSEPYRVVLWPHKKDGDWLNRVDFNLPTKIEGITLEK